jgi:hypothetical protein
MARPKLPDRVICIQDRGGTGHGRFRVHCVEGGRRVPRSFGTREAAESYAASYTLKTAPLTTKWRKGAKAFASKTGVLRRFLAPVELDAIGTVTPSAISRCCRAWDTPEHGSYWTRHGARVRVKAFFNWCVETKLIKASPMRDIHRVPKERQPIRRLRRDEARRLRDVVEPAANDGVPGAVFVLAAMFLGPRTSEFTGLTAASFDDGGQVVIYPDAKDPTKVHEVRLPDELVGPFATLARRAGKGALFPTAGRHPQTWGARQVRLWATAAELPQADEMDVRWLRRTKDSIAVEAGLSPRIVAEETGHSLAVARRHYISSGAETTGRAASMERATRTSGNDTRPIVTEAANLAE